MHPEQEDIIKDMKGLAMSRNLGSFVKHGVRVVRRLFPDEASDFTDGAAEQWENMMNVPFLPDGCDLGCKMTVRLRQLLPVTTGSFQKVLASLACMSPHYMQTKRIVSHHNLVVDNHRTSMGENTRNARLMVALNGVDTAYFDPRPAVVKFLEKTRRSGAPDWDIYGQREFVRKFTRETGLFYYVVVDPPDHRFGVAGANGSFNGMIGQIQRKEVDFGVGNFGIIESRQKVVDYTAAWWVDHHVIVMRKQDPSASQTFLCLGPFSTTVWCLLVATVLLVGFFMWLVTWYNPLRTRDSARLREYLELSVWQSFSVMLQQSLTTTPSAHSGRIVVAFWWCCSLIVVGSYNGNLVAFLTAPEDMGSPITSLEDLSSSPKMGIGFLADTDLHELFKQAHNDTYAELWRRIQHDSAAFLVDEPIDGLRRAAREPDYVFLTDESFYEAVMAKDHLPLKCNLVRAKQHFMHMMYGFPFQKDSPYLAQFTDKSQSKNISPLPNSNRTTSHLPTISSTTGDITTISLSALTDKTYTYTTNFFDNAIWSNGYVDDCEIQYTSNSFMSTFEMLDVATPTGMLRERMASDTPRHRTHWNHDYHRNSLPDLSTQVENGYSRTHTRKFGGSLSDGNCTDAETGEFSLNLVGTSEL
ncbi:hypothetical protein LSAT2_025596 [Lamellibrachia satsuma]|nr:hypothetical protein LSAT2_025596 [Lamellibrachia satsuma]